MDEGQNIRNMIENKLREIEQAEHVRILFAAESGSRAWGFASPDSDYDVRFIYVREPEYYLRLERTRDVIEWQLDDVFDISGWDLQKALRLIYMSNPTVMEWLSSDIVYRAANVSKMLIKAAGDCFSVRASAHHYLHMAGNNYKDLRQENGVKLKKYFYVLRPLLAAKWTVEKQTQPPMRFTALAEAELDKSLEPYIDKLLQDKSRASEFGTGADIPELDAFIDKELSLLNGGVGGARPWELDDWAVWNRDWTTLNRIFLSCIDKKGWIMKQVNKDLMDAIYKDDAAGVLKCLQNGADVNFYDENGMTPLQLAFSGYDDFSPKARDNIIIALVEAGADVNVKLEGNDPRSPLMRALVSCNDEIGALVVRHGAKIDTRDDVVGFDVTPLMMSSKGYDGETTKLLLERGADLSARDEEGGQAIHYAAEEGNLPPFKMLVEAGADINARDDRGCTPLMRAIENFTFKSAEYLIACGADVNAQNDEGQTALMLVSPNNSNACFFARLLLDAGADRELRDKNGKTAAETAAQNTEEDISEFLRILSSYVSDSQNLRSKLDIENNKL